MAGHNIVLTGLPRSGTTLSCNLLNRLDNVLALSEPLSTREFGKSPTDHARLADTVADFFERTRQDVLRRGLVLTQHIDGEVPEDSFEHSSSSFRKQLATTGEVSVDKRLDEGFTLVIKYPAFFTVILGALAEHLPCYAIVRNPVSATASFMSIGVMRSFASDTKRNKPQEVLRHDEKLVERLSRARDWIEWQLILLDWRFAKFHSLLPSENIIRYEDLIASGGSALSRVVKEAKSLREPLTSKNLNPAYDHAQMREFAERLLQSDGAYWRYYSHSEVEGLLV